MLEVNNDTILTQSLKVDAEFRVTLHVCSVVLGGIVGLDYSSLRIAHRLGFLLPLVAADSDLY